MRLRYYGTRAQCSTPPSKIAWRFLARPKPACGRVGLGKVGLRVGVIQTRMAHITGPSSQGSPFSPESDDNCPRSALRNALATHLYDLFRRSPPNLSEQLLLTITSSPGFDCVLALSATLTADPEILDNSIRSLVQVLPRTAYIWVGNDYNGEEPGPFPDVFKTFVAEVIYDDELQELHIVQPISPSQVIFFAALFSATAVKHGLLDEDFIYAFTRCGLQLPAVDDPMPELAAIGAIGACLQLVTAGSVFMEKHFAETEGLANVIAALEDLRVKSCIVHPRGLELLEKTIEAAKAEFANPLSPFDAWKVLFPSEWSS